jgi:hemerythrin superfamily protein
MANPSTRRPEASTLPEGDVVRVLMEQHTRIRDLFADVRSAEGEHKQQAFDELRALLAAHETAEEMILRPVSRRTSGAEIADARNAEEADANKVLAALEHMDVSSAEFDRTFAGFERDVLQHADQEEVEEFPGVLAECDAKERARMGRALRAAEAIAPTHPHPSTAGSPIAQWTVGPLISLVDRARDAIRAAMPGS